MDMLVVMKRPQQPAGHAPPRRSGSARRTSSIDVSWPDGREGNLRFDARARDVVTPRAGGAPIVCAEDAYVARIGRDRTVLAIEATPARKAMPQLVGKRGGGHLRMALEEVMPEERRNATPLYLILDDISGASLVAGWAWSLWDPQWLETMRKAMNDPAMSKSFPDRAGICSGFAPGSSAFTENVDRNPTPVPDLRNPADPDGWHAFTEQKNIGMRRARRIDVWVDELIHIETAFQDSASTPAGGRAAVHEYRLSATADPVTRQLLSAQAEPRILPFPECTNAPGNLQRLLGTPLPELRARVLAELRGTAGCTHLNDVMRALAEVPALVEHLRRRA